MPQHTTSKLLLYIACGSHAYNHYVQETVYMSRYIRETFRIFKQTANNICQKTV